jgi:hypothetical protein
MHYSESFYNNGMFCTVFTLYKCRYVKKMTNEKRGNKFNN